MQRDYTDITIILDRSGSMESIKNDMVEGIKNFIAEQKRLPGQCLLSLVQFDTVSYDNVFTAKPIKEVSGVELCPRGGTPLLDALGRTINETGKRLNNLPEWRRPEFVIVMVITDGEENSSREFTNAKIKEMTEHQIDKYKWNFTYLGANQDAFHVAGGIGIPVNATLNYTANRIGVQAMYSSVNQSVSNLRSHQSQTLCYNEADKQAQDDAAKVSTHNVAHVVKSTTGE